MKNKMALIARKLRFLRDVRGWKWIAQSIVPREADNVFCVKNAHEVHSGHMADFIQRQLYLFGGYE